MDPVLHVATLLLTFWPASLLLLCKGVHLRPWLLVGVLGVAVGHLGALLILGARLSPPAEPWTNLVFVAEPLVLSIVVGAVVVRESRRGDPIAPTVHAVSPRDPLAAAMERAAELDVPQLTQAALDAICQHLAAPAAFVALRGEGATLAIRAASHGSSLRPGDVVALPLTPRQARPVECCQAVNGEAVALLIPLRTTAEEHGVLGVGPRAGAPFAAAEVQRLIASASHLSLAIENAELRRRLTEARAAFSVSTSFRHAAPTELPQRGPGTSTTGAGAAADEVTVSCLGELTVAVNGRRVAEGAWGGRSSGHRHAKALLSFLVANRQRTVSRDELIDVIWGDDAELAALENRLDRTVCALRRALEPGLCKGARSAFILSEVGGYRLNPSVRWRVDAEAFVGLLDEAASLMRSGNDDGALARCLEAVALYQGDYLASCPFVDRSHLVNVQREALWQQYLDALLSIAELYRRLGFTQMQIRYLHRAAQEDECNERAYQGLVAVYCEQRRHAEARRLCREHRAKLAAAEVRCSDACFRDVEDEVSAQRTTKGPSATMDK